MIASPSTPNRSSARRWPRLLVVVAAAAVAMLTAVAADDLGSDPVDHRTTTDDALYRRLVNEGQIPGARDDDVRELTRRLVNEGLIPRAAR